MKTSMLTFQRKTVAVLLLTLLPGCCTVQAQSGAAPSAAATLPPQRDGSHDFDFEIGTWKTHLKDWCILSLDLRGGLNAKASQEFARYGRAAPVW